MTRDLRAAADLADEERRAGVALSTVVGLLAGGAQRTAAAM